MLRRFWIQKQTERNTRETERLKHETEALRYQLSLESARQIRELGEDARSIKEPSIMEMIEKNRAEKKRKEAEEEGEIAAETIKHQNAVTSAQSRNQITYLIVAMAGAVLIGFVVKKLRNGVVMTAQEKSGVLTMTIGALIPSLTLLFTIYPWRDDRDFFGNLFIADIVIGGEYVNDPLLSFPVSWLVFSGILFVAYGFLMFLDVIKGPAWLTKKPEDETVKPGPL